MKKSTKNSQKLYLARNSIETKRVRKRPICAAIHAAIHYQIGVHNVLPIMDKTNN